MSFFSTGEFGKRFLATISDVLTIGYAKNRSAVWLPGQLEREIKEGLWTLSETPVTKFDDLLGYCLSPLR